MNIRTLSEVNSPFAKELTQARHEEKAEGAGNHSFSSFLSESVNNVNSLLNTSDRKNVEVAVGKSENLHAAMISYEKAESALKLLVQVRNKALDAYHEVMRMQA
jgi:flagellar hook-basal body complex protein FliE